MDGRDAAELLELAHDLREQFALLVAVAVQSGVIRLISTARDDRGDALAPQRLDRAHRLLPRATSLTGAPDASREQRPDIG